MKFTSAALLCAAIFAVANAAKDTKKDDKDASKTKEVTQEEFCTVLRNNVWVAADVKDLKVINERFAMKAKIIDEREKKFAAPEEPTAPAADATEEVKAAYEKTLTQIAAADYASRDVLVALEKAITELGTDVSAIIEKMSKADDGFAKAVKAVYEGFMAGDKKLKHADKLPATVSAAYAAAAAAAVIPEAEVKDKKDEEKRTAVDTHIAAVRAAFYDNDKAIMAPLVGDEAKYVALFKQLAVVPAEGKDGKKTGDAEFEECKKGQDDVDLKTLTKSTSESNKKSGFPIWGYAVIGVAAVGAIGGGAYFMLKKKDEKADQLITERV